MNHHAHSEQLFESLSRHGIVIPEAYRQKIESRLNQVINYEPRVGVFGKTGAGKSSLCNALFGRDVCPVSDIAACTRSEQEVFLGIGSKGMTLLDVPGVGESGARDQEYAQLYRTLLPKLDLVLWVIKADDRALASDEDFYKRIVSPYIQAGTPFFIVLNQVDKIEPFREWDEAAHQPGPRQACAIDEKRRAVAAYFGLPLDQVLPCAADEQYGLIELVDAVIHALPREKRAGVLIQVQPKHRSEKAKQETGNGLLDTIVDVIVDIVPFVPGSAKKSVKNALKSFCKWVGSLF